MTRMHLRDMTICYGMTETSPGTVAKGLLVVCWQMPDLGRHLQHVDGCN